MGVFIDKEMPFSLFFADDQVIVAGDKGGAHYVFRKLKEEYERWELTIINMSKTEYLKAGDNTVNDDQNEYPYQKESATDLQNAGKMTSWNQWRQGVLMKKIGTTVITDGNWEARGSGLRDIVMG